MPDVRKESDSLVEVEVPADKLWGAQTQRSLEHFSIGTDLIPREMITAYAILKKAAANANHADKRLDDQPWKLIVNVNEVISNRCCQIAGTPPGSKTPVHANDHVDMAQVGTMLDHDVAEVGELRRR
jgi:fumarate hydratase class II